MTDADTLLAQIEQACKRLKMAQTTFGRQAVNDGKFVSRLQQGGRVTLQTVERVHRFIAEQGGPSASTLRSAIIGREAIEVEQSFRFYDNRQKYLMFVNTSSEKQEIVDRALKQLAFAQPRPPAIRLFDGGAGDGTALTRLLRGAHRRYSWLPFYVVAKEISLENVRLMLEKMPDRFQEHPATVLVVTNLPYAEAPWLNPANPVDASRMVWEEVSLEGTTAGDFEEGIAELRPFLERNWRVRRSARTGHPLPEVPSVLVIHRRDQRFALDAVIPRRGQARADFDFVLLSQPYSARAELSFKVKSIVTPLVRSLRPSGQLMGVHSYGADPGMELIHAIWPAEDPFAQKRQALMAAVRDELGRDARKYQFHDLTDEQSVFRYGIQTTAGEIDETADIGSSTLLAAWNAASYVAQIPDDRLSVAMNNEHYLDATRNILRKHGGLWFQNETYIVSRRVELG